VTDINWDIIPSTRAHFERTNLKEQKKRRR